MSDDLNTIFKDGSYYIHSKNTHKYDRAQSAQVNYNERNISTQLNNVRNIYKRKFQANISGDTIEGLARSLNISEEEFIQKVNDQVGKALQTQIAQGALEELYRITSKGKISAPLKSAFQTKDGEKQVQQVGKALRIIGEALKLIDSDNGFIGAVLIDFINNKGAWNGIAPTTLKGLGDNLLKMLENYKRNLKNQPSIMLIKEQSLNHAVSLLENFGAALSSGQFSTGKQKDISAEGLAKILRNGIVSTSIAEGLGGVVAQKVEGLLENIEFQSAGTGYTPSDSGGRQITNKTDIKAEGVSVSLSTHSGKNTVSFNMNIGISSKFYTSQTFKQPNGRIPATRVSSGSGGSLRQAIDELFMGDIDRYLIYNYFAHDDSGKLERVNNYLLKRNIIRLFASAGQNDFAQFMLINGVIVSTWDIMNYALEVIGQSKGDKQGVILSIDGKQDILDANKWIRSSKKNGRDTTVLSWNRSHRVNEKISKAKIKAELHLANLLKGVQKLKT